MLRNQYDNAYVNDLGVMTAMFDVLQHKLLLQPETKHYGIDVEKLKAALKPKYLKEGSPCLEPMTTEVMIDLVQCHFSNPRAEDGDRWWKGSQQAVIGNFIALCCTIEYYQKINKQTPAKRDIVLLILGQLGVRSIESEWIDKLVKTMNMFIFNDTILKGHTAMMENYVPRNTIHFYKGYLYHLFFSTTAKEEVNIAAAEIYVKWAKGDIRLADYLDLLNATIKA